MRYILILTILMAQQSVFACTKDTDCKGDRICVLNESSQGQCQSPSSSASQSTSRGDEGTDGDLKNDSQQSFHLNLLGLLQFGLTPTLEWGKDVTFLIRARLLNTGVLSYVVAAADGGELAFGLGTSVQVRKYLNNKAQRGPYLGGGVELMYTKNEGDETYETYFFVPQIEVGYRWLSDGYFSGFGVFGGSAIPVKTIGYSDGESIYTGGLIWDMGWFF